MSVIHVFTLALMAGGQVTDNTGVIEGLVVNACENDRPVAEADVVLQVRIDGRFSAVEQTVSDAEGRFRFESLPVGLDLVYLPGANRDGVHYPGRRIELTSRRSNAYLTLAVRDGVAGPDPLVVREHEIVIRGEPGVLHVVEAMLVDNPGQTTFIGQAGESEMPITLSLGIPMDFARLTFEKEFFGRQFVVRDGRVVTSIPWTPGPRWVRYTYSIPNENVGRLLQRKLDLPSEHVRIRVLHDQPDEVTCSLPAVTDVASGEAVFQTAGELLPAGHEIQVRLGRLPLPWMFYARWTALVLLLGLVVVAASVIARRSAEKVAATVSDRGRTLAPTKEHQSFQASEPNSPSRKKRRRLAA